MDKKPWELDPKNWEYRILPFDEQIFCQWMAVDENGNHLPEFDGNFENKLTTKTRFTMPGKDVTLKAVFLRSLGLAQDVHILDTYPKIDNFSDKHGFPPGTLFLLQWRSLNEELVFNTWTVENNAQFLANVDNVKFYKANDLVDFDDLDVTLLEEDTELTASRVILKMPNHPIFIRPAIEIKTYELNLVNARFYLWLDSTAEITQMAITAGGSALIEPVLPPGHIFVEWLDFGEGEPGTFQTLLNTTRVLYRAAPPGKMGDRIIVAATRPISGGGGGGGGSGSVFFDTYFTGTFQSRVFHEYDESQGTWRNPNPDFEDVMPFIEGKAPIQTDITHSRAWSDKHGKNVPIDRIIVTYEPSEIADITLAMAHYSTVRPGNEVGFPTAQQRFPI